MTVLVWITEDSWAAFVDAVGTLAPGTEDVTLLHVTDARSRGASRPARPNRRTLSTRRTVTTHTARPENSPAPRAGLSRSGRPGPG